MDKPDVGEEDRLRLLLAVVRARATDDDEAMRVLVECSHPMELAEGLADVALLMMSALSQDPLKQLDRMFHALTMGGRW